MLVLDCAEEDVPSVKELFERNGRFSGINSVLPIREGRRGRGRGRGGRRRDQIAVFVESR